MEWAMDDNGKRTLPYTRKEDYKKEFLGAVLGIIGAIFISGSGVLRWGKFSVDDASALDYELRQWAHKEFLRRDHYKEKHADMLARVKSIENSDKQLILDIRQMYSLIADLPPDELKDQVAGNNLRILHIEREHQWLMQHFNIRSKTQ